MVSKLNLSIDIIAINKNNHLCLEIEPSSDLYVYKLECPCANCGNKATHLHHIVQLSKGGTN